MEPKKFLYFLLFLTVILINSCHSVKVEKYKGNGTIYKVGSFPISYGYKIDFGEFDLDKNYNEEIVLQNYPEIEKEYIVGLYIESRSDSADSDLDSYLSIKAVTFKGDTLFDCRGKMSSWRWSRSGGDKKGSYKYFVYYMTNEHESGFSISDIPTENSTLYLYVDYEPPGEQGGIGEFSRGSVQLQVGGYK